MQRPTRSARRTRGSATVQDVARLAGVSPMTVSRVVNGEKNVRDSTRKAVLSAVQQLNYVPNAAARSLARAEAAHIGLLHMNPSASYLSKLMVGALEGCRRQGCQLVVAGCGAAEDEDVEGAQRLVDDAVDGVVLVAPLPELSQVREVFSAAGIPFVGVAVGETPDFAPNVRIDDFAAAHDLTRHLLAAGHRRICFIRGHPNQSSSERRYQGFAAALEEARLQPQADLIEQGYFSYRSGLEAADRLLSRPAPPTAIFASNDDMAAATVSVAHRRGLLVPDDVSIVGFDDTAIATTVWPELTTVRQPVEAMVEAALGLLLEELRARRAGEAPERREEVLAYAIIERGSVAAPRARPRLKA